jgi:ribosomal protein L11 methylase PrmA
VVLDVGTGSGLLAFFAVQAGAKIVYAVEASDSAAVAMDLCKANGMEGRVKIIKGKIEEVRMLQHTHSHAHTLTSHHLLHSHLRPHSRIFTCMYTGNSAGEGRCDH